MNARMHASSISSQPIYKYSSNIGAAIALGPSITTTTDQLAVGQNMVGLWGSRKRANILLRCSVVEANNGPIRIGWTQTSENKCSQQIERIRLSDIEVKHCLVVVSPMVRTSVANIGIPNIVRGHCTETKTGRIIPNYFMRRGSDRPGRI